MWTPAALASEVLPYGGDVWRVVETQYKAATARITDTLEEQAVLEELLEQSKPPLPEECAGLDFLLATPFRYSPYPGGSRFRRAGFTAGVFYASEAVTTAIAEIAFYRLLFFAQSPDVIFPTNPVEHTAFTVLCRSERAIDLMRPPFDVDADHWAHPTNYEQCQTLADAARNAEVNVIRYKSVRDPDRGINTAILSPAAFVRKQPDIRQTWHIFPQQRAVRAWCEYPKMAREYPVEIFLNDSRLASLKP